MVEEQKNRIRKKPLIEELWQLIQKSKAPVAETMRLAAKAHELQRAITKERRRIAGPDQAVKPVPAM